MRTPSANPNELLLRLPRSDRKRVLELCDTVPLEFGPVFTQADSPIRNAYFPTTALISILMPVEGRAAVEVGMVGREGFLGLELALASGISACEAQVQVKETALRMRSGPFLSEYRSSPASAARSIGLPTGSWTRLPGAPSATSSIPWKSVSLAGSS